MAKKWRMALLVLVPIVLAVSFVPETWLDFLDRLGNRAEVVGMLDAYGALGPVLLSGLILLQVFLAWIPGHALMVAGGLVYGFKTAFLIVAATTILGSQMAFLLARYAGRPLVERFVPENVLNRWESVAEKQGALFFLMTFWLPVFPSDMMCFIAGLGRISPRKFFLANFFGRLPVAVLTALMGAHLYDLPPYTWIALLASVVVSLCVWTLYQRRTRSLAAAAF